MLGIFKAYHEISKMEILAKEARCTGYSFAHRRAWLYFEVGAFLINIILLMLVQMKQLKFCGGGHGCGKVLDAYPLDVYPLEAYPLDGRGDRVESWNPLKDLKNILGATEAIG